MPSHDSKYFDDYKYLVTRSGSLRDLFKQAFPRELDAKIFCGVFEHLLAKQGEDGSWQDPDGKWTAVQTAVILKALARLGYAEDCTWEIQGDREVRRGSIAKALTFFRDRKEKLHPGKVPNEFVEDIWDVCQVLQAVGAYHEHEIAEPLVASLEANWKAVYKNALSDRNQDWAGPGFLSALLEVFVAYRADRHDLHQSVLHDILQEEKGNKYDGFLWQAPAAEGCWHASLVLRTICRLPETVLSPDSKAEIVNRIVPHLLSERQDKNNQPAPGWGYRSHERHRPMYTARALEALTYSLPYLNKELAKQVREATIEGNQELFALAKEEESSPGVRVGSLKATTAVAEYFSALTVQLPSQAVVDAVGCMRRLTAMGEPSGQPLMMVGQWRPVENGLRIAWLSDIHISDVKLPQHSFIQGLKRTNFFRALFQKQRSALAEPFAMTNLQHILNRVAELEVHHILITGDITMLALSEQFRLARDQFINLQGRLYARSPEPKQGLSRKLWTILPGNHDVDRHSSHTGEKLSLFFDAFGDTYQTTHFDDVFPIPNVIPSPAQNSRLRVQLIGLDSTADAPVQVIGLNAMGKIPISQLKRLEGVLSTPVEGQALRLVALHHHLLNIPYVKSELEEDFMQLERSAANKLVNLCSDWRIQGILHGHYHVFSPWFAPIGAPRRITGLLPIIGAPCGTLEKPGQDVQFLELREVQRDSPKEPQPALLLYRQYLTTNDSDTRWAEEFTGVCFG